LNLDQHVGATNVDNEALEWDFELVARLGIVFLERSVQRALVQSANMWRLAFDLPMVILAGAWV
jgi:hypothetical protein